VRRGEIWVVAGGGDYTARPRPVVILQDDRFPGTDSVTVAAFTTNPVDAPLFRVAVAPGPENGLDLPSRIMADKITTVRRARLQRRIGHLSADDLVRLNQAVLVFLGFAGGPRPLEREQPSESEQA
jgi:mRNA interferase MazF